MVACYRNVNAFSSALYFCSVFLIYIVAQHFLCIVSVVLFRYLCGFMVLNFCLLITLLPFPHAITDSCLILVKVG